MFDNFAEVERAYNTTPPVNEKGFGTSRDIRPLGERRYKEQRIIKIDDNTYALSSEYWSILKDPGGYYKHRISDPTLLPIVWRRAADGTETISIRNGNGSYGYHNDVYKLLREYLPWRLSFVRKETGHYISHGGDNWFLPFGRTVKPDQLVEFEKHKWTKGKFTTEFDGATLTFERTGRFDFKYVQPDVPVPKATVKRVDVERKKEWAPAIKEFVQWFEAISPLLPDESLKIRDLSKDWAERVRDHYNTYVGYQPASAKDWFHQRLEEVLLDPNHPMRMAAAVSLKCAIIWSDQPEKAAINQWINNSLDLFIRKEIE